MKRTNSVANALSKCSHDVSARPTARNRSSSDSFNFDAYGGCAHGSLGFIVPKTLDEKYSDEEARRRFERAVDAALHTPPMHRAPKKPVKAKPKAKKAKAKR